METLGVRLIMNKKNSIALALAMVLGLTITTSHAQFGPPVSPPADGLKEMTGSPFPKGQYAQLDKLPDWGGAWFRGFSMPAPGSAPPAQPKLKGKYKKGYEAYMAEAAANNGMVKSTTPTCQAPGMPIFMQIPQYPYEFLFTPGRITINQEAWTQTRRIWTDGRKHPVDPDPSFFGHSTAYWEGEALVIDTIGINDSLDIGQGMKHSDKLHISERIYLKPGDPDTLIAELILNDPEALEEPFSTSFFYKRDRYGDLIEFQCAENNRNKVDAEGNILFH